MKLQESDARPAGSAKLDIPNGRALAALAAFALSTFTVADIGSP